MTRTTRFNNVGRRLSVANNVPVENAYKITIEDFAKIMPQFFDKDGACLVPSNAVELFLQDANNSILQCRWLDKWEYGVCLYIAHTFTLYLRNYKPSNDTAQGAAATGTVQGLVSSSSLGDTSISFENGGIMTGIARWGVLASTSYGQQYASMARMVGIGGMYGV